MAQEKQIRNELIMTILRDKTQAEVAREFGISRERVRQIVAKNGGLPSEHRKYIKYRVPDEILGTDCDTKIAKQLGVPINAVTRRRVESGIPKFIKKIGCPICATNPYAKGMCKNCYSRYRRIARIK